MMLAIRRRVDALFTLLSAALDANLAEEANRIAVELIDEIAKLQE